MDASTKAITVLPELTVRQNITNILSIYNAFRDEEDDITLETVSNIFTEIDNLYYKGTFRTRFLASGPNKKRNAINYKDSETDCDNTESFLEAVAYDEDDDEFATNDYGFHIALTCLNSIDDEKVFYSGGYITKSKIIYIILMLLHESIHIIEYKDSLLTESENEHTVYFFQYGYKRFKLLSRLSQMMDDESELAATAAERIADIVNLEGNEIVDDGVDILNDHSSYRNENTDTNVSLGYVVHDICNTARGFRYIENIRAGGKTRRNRKNNRKTRRH